MKEKFSEITAYNWITGLHCLYAVRHDFPPSVWEQIKRGEHPEWKIIVSG